MTRPGTWFGNDDVVDEQRGIRAAMFESRNELLDDCDDVMIGLVVCALVDQESSGIFDRLWLEEALLKKGHLATKIIIK